MDYNKLGLDADLIKAVAAITEASCSSKKMEKEELHPNQKVLDKNKNGKIDAHDFKLLRKEEEDLDEAMTPMQKLRDAHDRHTEKALAANKAGDDEATKVHQKYMQKITDKMNKLKRNESVELGEEIQILDELSKGTLANYTQKAAHDVGNKMYSAAHNRGTAKEMDDADKPKLAQHYDNTANKQHSKALTRLQGIKTAAKKLAKEEFTLEDFSLEEIQDFMMSEDFEQLDELSKNTLGSYVKKAANDMGKHGAALAHKKASADEVDRMTNRNDISNKFDAQDKMKAALGADSKSQQKDYDKIGKRQSGIHKAVTRLTKEQVEEIEMLAAKHGLGE